MLKISIVLLSLLAVGSLAKYEPNWASLDSRPIPTWFEDAKLGIFIHYGVFSVPAYGTYSEWFWWYWLGEKHPDLIAFMERNYPKIASYTDFAHDFKAEFFDANKWAKMLEKSGAKYVVLTTKHHDGFNLWPTKFSWNWNAWEIGPRRDIIGEFSTAIRNLNGTVKLGLYHSLYEWFNTKYTLDRSTGWKTRWFPEGKTIPELYELINTYKPDLLWSDGDAGPDWYFNSTGFLAWLYNESPVKDIIVTNDRWGDGMMCNHGGYYTCVDRYQPGHLVQHKWENCYSIDKRSWGYRRDMTLDEVIPTVDLIQVLIETVAFNGNMLLNIAPNSAGVFDPIFEERLMEIGAWLQINGEAIYSTRPWDNIQQDFTSRYVYFTKKGSTIYILTTQWEPSGIIPLEAAPFGQQIPSQPKLIIPGGQTVDVKLSLNPNNQSQILMDLRTPQYGTMAPLGTNYAWVVKFEI